ncbi:9950_t:CDS:2, partial [Funneliformis geosporum]
EKYLLGFLTLDDIVARNDEGLTPILKNALFKRQEIPFMAIENEGSTERINGTYHYILRLYGHLINGQKVLVTLMDIQVFFDILVPDRETPDKCKEKDHTLVLTWDIETQSQELGEFAKVLDLNHNVFMISMILHWKDDSKPLKQICFVDTMIGVLLWKEHIISTYSNGCGRAKSENDFMKKYPVKAPEEGEEDLEEKEYMGSPIKIKISTGDYFTSSFLKLPDCVSINV